MLDPNQLRVFLVAAELLNFTRAAEKLHMTQPAVTHHIQALEAQLGKQLFIRKGRSMELTTAGRTLLPLAWQLVSVSMRAEELLTATDDDIAGQLVIGCSTTPGKYFLPILLSDFMTLHPHIQAACRVSSRDTAMEALASGAVQFAFSSSADVLDSSIEMRKFISEPIDLIVPLDHPWATRNEIEAQELLFARVVTREESAGTYIVVKRELAKQGINIADLRIVLTVGNSEAIGISVARGIGIGFVSRSVLTHMLAGKVAPVKVKKFSLEQDIYICRNRLRSASPVEAAFWEYVTQTDLPILRELGYQTELSLED